MDINLARTFLEVVATGSFVTAAERLHITQSTVSTRIRSLEEALGQALYARGKTGAILTPAGEQFQGYATAMVRIWQQARHDISLPPGYRSVIIIGGEISLWDQFLLDWLAWMNTHAPDVAIRAERGSSQTLITHLIQGTLDLGVMYTPQQRQSLTVQKLFESELVLVTGRSTEDKITADNYVYIDWGPEFRAYHSAAHPQLSNPKLYTDSAFIGIRYMLTVGGAGYIPERLARPYLDDARLVRAALNKSFNLPVHVVYSTDSDKTGLNESLRGLNKLAAG
ncbi:MAG: LysR family transcriptional regulator [Gammaproteobacteria bacterium]|nr:LysR family transcriptional regulator [Gammaproteobacteria bacterium]